MSFKNQTPDGDKTLLDDLKTFTFQIIFFLSKLKKQTNLNNYFLLLIIKIFYFNQ